MIIVFLKIMIKPVSESEPGSQVVLKPLCCSSQHLGKISQARKYLEKILKKWISAPGKYELKHLEPGTSLTSDSDMLIGKFELRREIS